MTSITDINSTLQNMVRLIGQIGLDLKNVLASIATGATPGGSNQQVQYNNSGAFGGINGSTWDGKNFALTAAAGGSVGGSITLTSGNTGGPSTQAGLVSFVGGNNSGGGRGGSIEILAGNSPDTFGGGLVALEGGSSTSGPGGFVGVVGGSSSSGLAGFAGINGGVSNGGGGGDAAVQGGGDGASGPGGNVYIAAGASNTGTPGNIFLGVNPHTSPHAAFPTTDPAVTGALWSMGGIVALSGTTPGISATIVTAKLTGGGSNGSMTFTNGILTAQTPAT